MATPAFESVLPDPPALRRWLLSQRAVKAVRTVAMAELAVPARLVLSGASTIGPAVRVVARATVVQFADLSGATRTLVWEPALTEALDEARLVQRAGRRGQRPVRSLSRRHEARQLSSIAGVLQQLGLRPDNVDFVAYGDLRGHDLRRVAGTTRPLAAEHQPRAPLFERAWIVVQARELEAVAAPHPLHAPWYVPGAADDLIADRVLALGGSVELGPGVALVATPGLTAGHQSLVIRVSSGVCVLSSNGVASDCWQPLLSKLPGIRRRAEADGLGVVLPVAGVRDPLAMYESMLLERSLADASRDDPRWLMVRPVRELAARWRQFPAVPTFVHQALDAGRIVTPQAQ